MSGVRDPLYDSSTWVLYHRPRGGGRWVAVATDLTFAAAVALSDGPGDWWYSPQKPAVAPKPAGKPKAAPAAAATPSLFS